MTLLRFAQSLLALLHFAQSLLAVLRFVQSLAIQWFQRLKKCPGTPSLKRTNGTINMHSRGSTEQYLCALDPHCGYLLKVKKVSWCPLIEEGHRLAIILENVLVPLIKEGQLSHKYAIANPVEPMNLLSKGPNESLPNIDPPYGKMSWYPVFYTTEVPELSPVILVKIYLCFAANSF